ncbi:beta-defensin 37-like [Apodemus sylvaticus]|uniref:beta-defensin 37-like n=1 Tax=Apodemus sylvaticus TaxID=10129 RepID=UPI002244365C|nr:beta-defensin 37-like [Apodemus sylvaticus]
MKISCFLLFILSLFCFQINPVAVLDTRVCFKNKDMCLIMRCPFYYKVVGTCYKGKGKCCHRQD